MSTRRIVIGVKSCRRRHGFVMGQCEKRLGLQSSFDRIQWIDHHFRNGPGDGSRVRRPSNRYDGTRVVVVLVVISNTAVTTSSGQIIVNGKITTHVGYNLDQCGCHAGIKSTETLSLIHLLNKLYHGSW